MEKIFSPEQFRKQAHFVVDMLSDYLAQVESRPTVLPWQTAEASLEFWIQKLDFEGGKSSLELLEAVMERSVKIHHPRYMGHQVGMVAPTAALAGLVTGLLNNGMAVYEMGISSVPLEQIICRKFAELFGLPPTAGGFMTSGGTLANTTALLAARQIKAGRNVWKQGQQGEKMAVMVSSQTHYCMSRAVQIMGWGEEGIIKIATDTHFKIRLDLLEEAYQAASQQGIKVIAIVGSACSTALGAFDDLESLADFAKQKNLWFHVDAAHGGPAILSPKYKYLLKGIEKADSITIDFHKMMMVPALASALIYRCEADAMQTFAQKAEYLLNEQETYWQNPAARTFECSKFMMSVKVAALIHENGLSKIGQYVEKCFDNGKLFAQIISQNPDFQLAAQPECNIVCFRYVGKNLEDNALNAINKKIREKLLQQGEFYILKTEIEGKTFFRVSLMNVFSSEKEFKTLLVKIKETAQGV